MSSNSPSRAVARTKALRLYCCEISARLAFAAATRPRFGFQGFAFARNERRLSVTIKLFPLSLTARRSPVLIRW